MLFQRLLKESGLEYPCAAFTRGDEAIDALIEVLRGAPPPLACFIDVRMPGMTGFDVLRWIRCQHPLDDIPVIMLSSSDEARDLGEAQHYGAQCYLTKYPSAQEFAEIVHEAERVAASASGHPFKLPCNLLLASPHEVG